MASTEVVGAPEIVKVIARGPQGAAGSGGSGPLGPFEFTFDTPGITDGVEFFTPTIGDFFMGALILVDEAFDGPSPYADIGPFIGRDDGIYRYAVGAACPLDVAANDFSGGYGLLLNQNWDVLTAQMVGAVLDTVILPPTLTPGAELGVITPIDDGDAEPVAPAPFVTADPWKVALFQGWNGHRGGTPVGGTQGSARVYIWTQTPRPFLT